jgi:hypothetical protein
MGNALFQYCLGRIIAEHHGLALVAKDIPGFLGTLDNVEGLSVESPELVLQGHLIDLNRVLADATPRRIVLRGWFQRYEYFQPYKSRIKQWLRYSREPVDPADPRDLIIHVRRGDYLWHGWSLPFSWYEQLIDQASFRRLILVTDDAKDPFFWRFQKYKPVIRSQSPSQDFSFLLTAHQLALSPSSFAWWAAFLGQAETIYFPIPKTGIWSEDSAERIDLRVTDEDRYHYVPATEALTLNLQERIWFEKLFFKRKYMKGRIRRMVSSILRF